MNEELQSEKIISHDYVGAYIGIANIEQSPVLITFDLACLQNKSEVPFLFGIPGPGKAFRLSYNKDGGDNE